MPTITGVDPERARLNQYSRSSRDTMPLVGSELEMNRAFVLPGTGRRRPTRPSVLAMRAEDLKQRGDDAFKRGNYRDAWTRYTESLDLAPKQENAYKLYSNRAMAYVKANRFEEGLADAGRAIDLKSNFEKAYFWKAKAYMGLRQYPEATQTMIEGYRLNRAKDMQKELWNSILKLTREQMASIIHKWILDAEEEGTIEPPEVETVSQEELVEGLFREMHRAHLGKPFPQLYYNHLFLWAKDAMPPADMYNQRSVSHCNCKCFQQAVLDANLALRQRPNWAEAWARKGAAYTADEHSDFRNWKEAAKSYTRAVDLEPENELYQDGLRWAGGNLSHGEMGQVLNEVYNGMMVGQGSSASAMSLLESSDGREATFRLEGMVTFPGARARSFSAKLREEFRSKLAEKAGVAKLRVTIDRVKQLRPQGLDIHFAVTFASDKHEAERFLERLQPMENVRPNAEGEGCEDAEDIVSIICEMPHLVDAMGEPSDDVLGQIVEVTPAAHPPDQRPPSGVEEEGGGPRLKDGSKDRRLHLPARPKMEIELPYKMYKLVKHDGTVTERITKHPFQLSRVYYAQSEQTENVWVETMDHVLRWRQSAGEVKVMALKVPKGVKARHLEVTIEIRFIRVANRATGDVYLEGDLFRGIIPEESHWTHLGGLHEDGFMLYLRKMNLELHKSYWEHANSWWEKLFTEHVPIKWDDYDKDYSDLPSDIRRIHDVREAKMDEVRALEHKEKTWKDNSDEQEEFRMKYKELRLAALGAGYWSHEWYDVLKTDDLRTPTWIPPKIVARYGAAGAHEAAQPFSKEEQMAIRRKHTKRDMEQDLKPFHLQDRVLTHLAKELNVDVNTESNCFLIDSLSMRRQVELTYKMKGREVEDPTNDRDLDVDASHLWRGMTEARPSKKAVDLGRIDYARVTEADRKKEGQAKRRAVKKLLDLEEHYGDLQSIPKEALPPQMVGEAPDVMEAIKAEMLAECASGSDDSE
eukprot:scaffold2088_cov399-Prasinococcus_capsulatus_cf.AAC.56